MGEQPWGAALDASGDALYVTQFLRNPGVTVIATGSFTVSGFVPLPAQPPDPTQLPIYPNGEARALYAVVPRPGTGEIWLPHLLSASQTPQPALTFDTAVFPTISRLPVAGGSPSSSDILAWRILFQPPASLLGPRGTFTDSVSGPRDLAFTPDGSIALVAMAQSEDVMVFDANTGDEIGLVRPTPAALPEGIAVDASGSHAYLHGRGSHDLTVLDIKRAGGSVEVDVDGDSIECLASDPMPPALRRGFRLFYSANSAAFPITRAFWLACASCHPEGGTDAITWKLLQGPRDTPSLAGGLVHTGFLMRQALLDDVVQVDTLVRELQGGSYDRDDPSELPDLEALASFVNEAIPYPQNPNLAPASQNGRTFFAGHCADCHAGSYETDSGSGNPGLDLGGLIVLHDVGTCVTGGAFPDRPAVDAVGRSHAACQFDTPTLRGIFATPPYFHDGSAPTLEQAVEHEVGELGQHGDPVAAGLSPSDEADLVAYLRSL